MPQQKLLDIARNAVLIFSWASVVKNNAFDIIYGMGPSMEPVVPNGCILLVDRSSFRWQKLKRGDVIVFRSPTRADGATVCKRILAMEGDVVELQPRFDAARAERITVTKGHIWVEGDNATMSVDSRHVGSIPLSLVVGRAHSIVWPWSRISKIR